MKFKIKDNVKVVAPECHPCIRKTGKIVEIDEKAVLPFKVEIETKKFWFFPEEIERA